MPKLVKGPGFRITGGHGFHITFQNGWTVSVQFGGGNYCSNYDDEIGGDDWQESGKKGSTDAETAVWGPDGELLDLGDGDTVQPRQSPEDVLELLSYAASGGTTELRRQPHKAEGR